METWSITGDPDSDNSDGSFIDDSFMIPSPPLYRSNTPTMQSAAPASQEQSLNDRPQPIFVRKSSLVSRDPPEISEFRTPRRPCRVHWVRGSGLTNDQPSVGHSRSPLWSIGITTDSRGRDNSEKVLDDGSDGEESNTDDTVRPTRQPRNHWSASNKHQERVQMKQKQAPLGDSMKQVDGTTYDCYPWSTTGSAPSDEAIQSQFYRTDHVSDRHHQPRAEKETEYHHQPAFTPGSKSEAHVSSNASNSEKPPERRRSSGRQASLEEQFGHLRMVPAPAMSQFPMTTFPAPNAYYDLHTGAIYFMPYPPGAFAPAPVPGRPSKSTRRKRHSSQGAKSSLPTEDPSRSQSETNQPDAASPRKGRHSRNVTVYSTVREDQQTKVQVIQGGLARMEIEE